MSAWRLNRSDDGWSYCLMKTYRQRPKSLPALNNRPDVGLKSASQVSDKADEADAVTDADKHRNVDVTTPTRLRVAKRLGANHTTVSYFGQCPAQQK